MTAKVRIEIDKPGLQVTAFSLTSSGAVDAGDAIETAGTARIKVISGAGNLTWQADEASVPSEDLGRRVEAGDEFLVVVGAGTIFQWIEAEDGPSAPGVNSNTYDLADGVNIASGASTTPITGVAGGAYILAITATAWNSATIKLQALGPDGTTWLDVPTASMTTPGGQLGVVVGENASLRLTATGGAPTGVHGELT